MPNKKKQQKNAFYFFMKAEEPALRREGRVFPNGMADMVVICHPRWKALPQKDKDRFEKMAKEYKAKMKGKEGDKYRLDNQGQRLDYRTNKYVDLDKRRTQEKKIMRKNWPPGEEVAQEKFYFVNFQVLCQTEEGHFLPCEIAIIEFSIEKGITKHLHRFIEPGKIPTGYRFTCIENSQDTHQIPVENFDQADSNYLGLWNQIENFINPNQEKDEYPPLYCLGAQENYVKVEYCLEWVHAHACTGIPNRIQHVFEVESLLQELLAHIGKVAAKSQCINWLNTSDWDYEPNTKCSYHEELEVKDCSLGIVNRYAYCLSDTLCEHYGIEITKNHIPMREKLANMTILPPLSMPNMQPPRFQQQAKPTPVQQKPVKRETVDDIEDYSDLRRPREPGYFGGGEPNGQFSWGGAPQNDVPYMGRGRPVQYNSDFPAPESSGGGLFNNSQPTPAPMGRGLSQAFQGMTVQDKHANMAGPPPANFAPDPPPSWMNQPMAMGMPGMMRGVGRGMVAMNQGNAPPGFSTPQSVETSNSIPDDYEPLRLPGQAAPVPVPVPEPSAAARAPDIQIGRGSGFGYGGILEKIMQDGVRPGGCRGRGLAPPDWVDDGSLGPVLR